jgi:Protein phosphatase 2C
MTVETSTAIATQEATPEMMPETRRGNTWRCVGASVRGTSHERTELPCQDAHYLERPSADLIIAAVADGAGSAALAEVGAAIATRTATEALCQRILTAASNLDQANVQAALLEAVTTARNAVEDEAAKRERNVRDFASTLLLMLATPTFVAAVQVGDGGVVLRDKSGNIVALTAPQLGEYINETCFLVSLDALENVQMQIWRGETAQVAMLTDGLQLLCLKMPEGTPHEPFFFPVFDFVSRAVDEESFREKLIGFLRSPRIRERTDDDVTLVLASLNETTVE